jgi:hypothetical protein
LLALLQSRPASERAREAHTAAKSGKFRAADETTWSGSAASIFFHCSFLLKKNKWPRRYALVARCLAAVERADAQFLRSRVSDHEQACRSARSCAGYQTTAPGKKTRRHFWVFDMRECTWT